MHSTKIRQELISLHKLLSFGVTAAEQFAASQLGSLHDRIAGSEADVVLLPTKSVQKMMTDGQLTPDEQKVVASSLAFAVQRRQDLDAAAAKEALKVSPVQAQAAVAK